MNTYLELSFTQQIEPFYRQLVELLLNDIDSLDDSEKQVRLEESRLAIEDLQKAELENFFPIAYLNTQTQNIVQIDPYAAAIYPIMLGNSLEIIYSIGNQPLQHFRTRFEENNQEKIFQEACQKLNSICQSSEILPSAQKLYDWLILPVEDLLQKNQITTLVFILDGLLRRLPMAALYDGKQYLIEKYNIALTPGLQLLPSPTAKKSRLSLLSGAITQPKQGCSAVPDVLPEIEQISQVISTKVLLDEEFTSKSLITELEQNLFSSVHLATHCQYSSRLKDTFILAWDGRLNINCLSNIGAQNEKNPEIALLVLSAGNKLVEDSRAMLGLSAIALSFQAKSTVAPLWSIRDRSTTNLMTEFYRLLAQSNISVAEALRQAQISLLQDPQYQHPYYWASFVLVGNWQ